jgi:4-oxalmesaconate hydratase
MYIDCHGHFTTVPDAVKDWRDRQIAAFERSGARLSPDELSVSDDELRAAIEHGQLPLQQERGTDVTLFSPIAGKMAHHYGDLETSVTWSRLANDVIDRVCRLFPNNFVGVCQLPQSPGAPIDACLEELDRCVAELGFVGCNLSPDPSDGYWQAPALTDEFYYPLYERLTELGVPAMVHTSMSCNPAVHGTCAHYLNGDTTAFMQLVQSDLFATFPTLRLIIPHGGGAVPYHWGRYRGVMQDMGRGTPEELVADNVFFDTCVYYGKGLQLLTETVPTANILYASEMIGAVRGVDPETGRRYDDTRYLLDSIELPDDARAAIASGNALRVYGRLEAVLAQRGIAPAREVTP